MKFSIARLCGGKALMVSPEEDLGLDMERAADVLSSIGGMKENDDMIIVISWKGMEVTVYPQGKIMFYPLSDREAAVKYASDILAMLSRSA